MLHDVEQGSDEWITLRLGKATASRISDIVAKTKSGYSSSRANYAAELVLERLVGRPGIRFISPAMAHGTETEPLARDAYRAYALCGVDECGFIDHPTIPMSGASPDGLVGDDGLVEIKCPISSTHLETLLNPTLPAKYMTQMQWQLACTGRAWCDFVSFDPRFPEALQLHVTRVARDDAMIAELEREVTAFLGEVDDKLAALTARETQLEAA